MFRTYRRNAVSLLCATLFSAGSIAEEKVSTKDLPTDKVATAEVNDGFNRWATTWMFDRYQTGSARITERGFKDNAYVIRGLFDFVRSGTKITIPFAAAYTNVNDGYALSNLCYNDTSSGMTDCINPNASLDDRRAAAMQSSQFLGSIVVMGLVAAMSDADDEVCVKRYTIFGEPYFECE